MENIDILNGELFIPMNENSKPNLDDILMKLNYLSETYGIPYNRTKFFEKWDEYFDKYKEMYERLKSMTGKTYINIDAKKQDDSHPAIILQKASGIPEEYFKNEKGKFSLNDFVMKKLKTNFSDNDYIKVIVDLKKYDNLVSNAKQLKDSSITKIGEATFTVEFLNRLAADVTSELPFVKRLSSRTIEFTMSDYDQAFHAFQAIVFMASSAMRL